MPPKSSEPQNQPGPAPERNVPPPPPDSPERIEQQRKGEGLLSLNGRIQDTPTAKTIAIQSLARRMRSSTPELALSAFGLKVGTDMVERLGDKNYYLVPENPRYPSMGANVYHRNELSPDQLDPAKTNAIRMDRPEADTLVRQISVSEVMGAWAYGSNNNARVLAIQEATKEEFGLAGAMEWRMDPAMRKSVDMELSYNRKALKDFVRSQYEMTQELLARQGVTEVVGYRAMTWPEGSARPDWAGLKVGSSFSTRHRPLARWSADRKIVADWLETRGGPGAILVDRTPSRDILSLPATGMGYFGQKEWVTLPGDRQTTLDGISTGRSQEHAAQKTAASSVNVGGPVLDNDKASPAKASAATPPAARSEEAGRDWQPLKITEKLNPSDPTDRKIIQFLDGKGEPPEWWPRDDSGYTITKRDLEFLQTNPVQIKWMGTKAAPMGMTPELYDQFGTEMLDAMKQDGFDPSQVDIRLKGTGSGFFSGKHKAMPTDKDMEDKPEAKRRYQEWFGNDTNRPLRRPHDAMRRLGMEDVPSDFDIDINSTAMIRSARKIWQEKNPDRYPGDFMGGHGYLNKQAVNDSFPALAAWAKRWEGKLGREVSLGAFESSGPVNTARMGRSISGHHQSTDWVIHNKEQPHPSLAKERNTPQEGRRSATGSHLGNLARRGRGEPSSPKGSSSGVIRRSNKPDQDPDHDQDMNR